MDKSEFEEFLKLDVVANDLRRSGGYLFGQLVEIRKNTVVLRGRGGGEVEVGHADVGWMMHLDDYVEAQIGEKVMLRERSTGRVRYGWLRMFIDGLLYVEEVAREHLPKMKEDYWEYDGTVVVVPLGELEYLEPYDFPLEDPEGELTDGPLPDWTPTEDYIDEALVTDIEEEDEELPEEDAAGEE